MYTLIILFLTGVITLFLGFLNNKKIAFFAALIGLSGALAQTVVTLYDGAMSFPGMLTFDTYSLSFIALAIGCTILIVLTTFDSTEIQLHHFADGLGLILFSLCGAVCLAGFDNLLMLFLGVEILSIPLYVLAGSNKYNPNSNEAALKYFITGSVASGILLFGICLVFGATGSLDMLIIRDASAMLPADGLFFTGLILMMAGMLFKLGAAPFHFWTPDVYEGSPTYATSFMSAVVKIAAIAAFIRLFMGFFGPKFQDFYLILICISVITMGIGNISALGQKNVKRMLAYSSIAHVGYLILGFVGLANTYAAKQGHLLLYIGAYSIASIAVLSVVNKIDNPSFDSFNGLYKKNPMVALVLTISLLSLAGIPVTAGFMGKYLLFSNVVPINPWWVVIALVNSAVSLYYYFKIIMHMFFKENTEDVSYSFPLATTIVLVVTVLCNILFVAYTPFISKLI